MGALTQYELERLKRIEENKRRMEELGVAQASQAIAASQAAAAGQAAPRAPRRAAQFVEVKEEDLRRSVRSKKEVNYNEHNLFRHAEAALRQAEAATRRYVVRQKQGGGGGGGSGKGQSVRIRGWHESYGIAGYAAQEQCMEEAHRLVDSLANPAFAKVLTPSMVSGGFWCSAPRGLKEALGVGDKRTFTAYLPEGQPTPAGACRLNDAGDGWDIVWLPHGKNGSSFGFSGNWVGFAVDNRLFPGDCLVCEVLPKEEPRGGSAFSLRFHVLRAYDYGGAEVKAACQAAWGTAVPIKEEEAAEEAAQEAAEEPVSEAAEQAAEEGGGSDGARHVQEEGGSAGMQQAQGEGASADVQAAPEADGSHEAQQPKGGAGRQGAQAAEQRQQRRRSEGSPAAEAAEAAELSDQGLEATGGEGAEGQGAVGAAGVAAAASRPPASKRKRQARMSEALDEAESSKRKRRTSAGGQASAAAASKQQGKAKSAATTAAGKRAAKQRPAKKQAGKQGRGAGKQAASRKGKRAPAEAPTRTEAAAEPEGEEEEEEVSYEVECILGVEGRGTGRRLHIKWWGYEETTWEPLSMLDQPLGTYPLAPGIKL